MSELRVSTQESLPVIQERNRIRQLLSRKRNSLRLTTGQAGRGHDRLVAQPASRVLAHAGMVLGRDIPSAIQVSIEMIPTLPTNECALRTTVVAGTMPAAATPLRSMSRIDRDHRTTPFFGLVLDFGFEACKRPRMHAAFCLAAPPGLRSFADVFEVFQHDRCARLGRRHDLLTEDVVGIFSEAGAPTLQLPQMSFGAFCAPFLQRTNELEVTPLNRFPAPLAQEMVIRRDRRAIDAQVNANHRFCLLNFRCGNAHDHMQPPDAIAEGKVSSVNRVASILRRVVLDTEANGLPTADERHAYGAALPIHAVGTLIVAWRAGARLGHADLPPRTLQRQRTFDGLGCLHSRLNEQVRRQRGQQIAHAVVGFMVQLDAIRQALLPAVAANVIERLRELPARFCERLSLRGRGIELYANSALHMHIIAYTV